ncbi:hypothetical protein D3C86_2119910 [compost metagenome]
MGGASRNLLADAYGMFEWRGDRRIHGFAWRINCGANEAAGNQMDGAFGGFDA